MTFAPLISSLRIQLAITRRNPETLFPLLIYSISACIALAVTVLTSLDQDDLDAVGARGPVADLVLRRARLAISAGADGVVLAELHGPSVVPVLRVDGLHGLARLGPPHHLAPAGCVDVEHPDAEPGSYNTGFNTQTLYQLYYFQQSEDGIGWDRVLVGETEEGFRAECRRLIRVACQREQGRSGGVVR